MSSAAPSLRWLLFALLLPALVLAPAGCGKVKEDRKKLALESATNGYRQAIRWGFYESAVGFLHPDVRPDVDFAGLSNVRVTAYETLVPAVITPDDKAVEVVMIEYVLNDRQVVKRLNDRQEWRYDPVRLSWWLHSGLPPFER